MTGEKPTDTDTDNVEVSETFQDDVRFAVIADDINKLTERIERLETLNPYKA